MTSSRDSSVLRDVSTPVQPLILARPRRALIEPQRTHPHKAAEQSSATAMAAVSTTMTAAKSEAYTQGFSRGQEEGRQAGMREGMIEAQARVEDAVQATTRKLEAQAAADAQQRAVDHATRMERLDRLLGDFEVAASSRLDRLETDAVALAFEAVCKVVGNTLAQPQVVSETVKHAIKQLRGGTLLRVRLHPVDLDALDTDEALALKARHPSAQWTADPQMTRGGCLLDTDQGSLDATLLTQLTRLREVWLNEPHQVTALGTTES